MQNQNANKFPELDVWYFEVECTVDKFRTQFVIRFGGRKTSSVARGDIALPIGMSTKIQNEKINAFLALLRMFYAAEWTK